jgi:hypothetical protein
MALACEEVKERSSSGLYSPSSFIYLIVLFRFESPATPRRSGVHSAMKNRKKKRWYVKRAPLMYIKSGERK